MCCGRKPQKRPKMTRSGLKKRKVVKEIILLPNPPYDVPKPEVKKE